MSVITKKICLLGDFNVGKTSLISRFVENKFSDRYLSTVGVKISRKSLTLPTNGDTEQINLLLWDLEGQTKFKGITPNYLKGASGSIIVADLTRINTLDSLSEHIKLFLEVNPQGQIAIALNKMDLLPSEKLVKLIELHNEQVYTQVSQVYTTSAKTGDNVVQIFEDLARNLLN